MTKLTYPQCCLYVARGLWLKYWAMWILLVTPVVTGVLIALKSQTPSIWWITAACLGLALAVDACGRVVCLMGDMINNRMLFISVVVQMTGIILAIACAPLIGVWCIYFLLTAQLMAALSFTSYLRQLAEHLNQPQLAVDASLLSGKVVALSGTTFVLGLGIGFILLLVLALFLSVVGWFVLALAGFLLPIFGSIVLLPVLVIWVMTGISMFTGYGLLLVRLRRALSSALIPN